MIETSENYLVALSEIRDVAGQRTYIADHPVPYPEDFVEQLAARIRDLLPRDPDLAESLAESGLHIASVIDTPLSLAQATRARAQVLYSRKRCAEAQPFFEQAVRLFSSAGAEGEVGRTLVVQMDNMSYLSRYEDAIRLEPLARAALQKAGDASYLCNLKIALGNFYYRLNRFAESLEYYETARSMTDSPFQIAAIGIGKANTLTDMNRFDEATQCFENTRQYCEEHGLHLWVDIVERDLARMHFSRGNYSTALRILERVRTRYEESNDVRRMGLCDRDRAEIYLQLNLFEDAASLAERAYQVFANLGNGYEAAMCLTFLGIAEFKLMRDREAEKAFLSARRILEDEGNQTWVALVDLWRAQLLIRQQNFSAAQELAGRAADVFEKQQVPVRAANARILSAQSWQEMDNPAFALEEASRAIEELKGFHAPWVSYQCHNTLGRLKELDGDFAAAEDLYLKAISEMESLRGSIRLDEFQISFGKDKYQVYENIVNLKLNRWAVKAAFEFVEKSKSRTLIDLLERNLETVWDAGEESPRLNQIRKIREELNFLYSKLNHVGAPSSNGADSNISARIAQSEHELVELLRGVGSEKSGWATLQSMKLSSVEDVQQMLGPDEILIEYYMIGDRYQAFVISHDDYHIVRDLASVKSIRASLKGLNFQLTKFYLQRKYLEKHGEKLLQAAQFHLRDLYRQLIEPLKSIAKGRTLVIVPHHVLHYVPFHALFDGESYLIDHHDVIYAPSASVLRVCRSKIVPKRSEDLVLGVADELTPFINDEVAALRQLLPNARVFTGAEASEAKLKEFGPSAGKIHIAAHGIFRSDNPMFSSLKLGENWLNLFDIFNLQLGAELTTLSACETGMSAVWEGDELLGLARGFLYAGTPSLVVSLWTVNDRSTAKLMHRFYAGLNEGMSKAHALREAMLEVKEEFAHPFYWAPFVLMGKS